jgi:VanZ family protein
MKWVTYIFIVLLILIVIAANMGLGPLFFSFVYLLPGGDKAGHFILMGLLSFLINSVMRASRVQVFSFDLLKGSLIVMAIVTIEELSQIFLKYRGFSLFDLFFDYTGIIIFGRFAAFILDRQIHQ